MLRFFLAAVGIGASIVVSAQSLAKLAYSSRPELAVITLFLSLGVLGLFSFCTSTKRYFGFAFVLAAIYGTGHILYDFLNAFLKVQDPHFPIDTHIKSATIALISAGVGTFLLVQRRK